MTTHPFDADTFEHVRLTGTFTLRSPLSHIGESVSTTSYLVQDPIVQPDGTVSEVFSYSGNAWRGQIRDMMARRVAEAAGNRLPLDSFHLLFGGGRLDSQEKTVDLDGARAIRATLPMVALLGGGIGTQLLAGKLRVFNSYPVCREAIPVLPSYLHEKANRIRYGMLTFEKEFSRRDDTRTRDGDDWLAGVPADEKPKKAGKTHEQQLRMGSELVAPGTVLYTEIHANHVSRVELGCLVRAISDFSMSPFIGGQANRGHGLATLAYDLHVGDETDEGCIFAEAGTCQRSPFAADLVSEFMDHMRSSAPEIRAVLRTAA